MQKEELPKLFGLSSKGKVKEWQVIVEETKEGYADLIIRTGYVGGKIRDIPKTIKKGKSIGRSNETNPY